MFTDTFDRMMVLFTSGLGLALLGCANGFLRSSAYVIRGAASLVVIGLMVGIAVATTGLSQSGVIVGSALLGISSVVAVAGSPWLARMFTAFAAAVRTPIVRWAVVGILGLGVAVGSVLQSEEEYFDNVDREMAELVSLTSPPPSDVPAARALTDFGREIALREATSPRSEGELLAVENAIFSRPEVRDAVIRTRAGSDISNCHGWVFTGGRYWLNGSEVERIVADNGYRAITDPQPGDLVVYRSGENILHSALVRYVTPGLPVLVEGKWGCSGIYIHPVDKSIYGANYQYYRSTRSGHVLAGMYSTTGHEARGVPQLATDPANPGEFTD